MIRKLVVLLTACCMFTVFVGCNEPEHKMEQKKETRTESDPEFTSPGEPIVE